MKITDVKMLTRLRHRRAARCFAAVGSSPLQ